MRILFSLIIAGTATLNGQAADAPASSTPSPAKVVNGVKESDLAAVVLTPQAEQRLGVKLVAVEKKTIPQTRLFAGEIVVPLANTASANAPLLTGSIEERLKLADLQTDADGRIQQAEIQLNTARITLERAQKMQKAEVGSIRAVDDANSAVQLAESALATAKNRRALLGKSVVEEHVSGKGLWLRVPVYVGELRNLDLKAEALVAPLIGTNHPSTAQPIPGPASANSSAATVDLFYEIKGSDFRLGERVKISLLTLQKADTLVVPFAAIVHDMHGGQWVYENTTPHTFVRRRVQVSRIAGTNAILAGGPPPGARIVTDGVAEIFGTEFGSGK